MRRLRVAWSDEQIELLISGLLRVGVVLAAAVVLAGGVYYLAQSGGDSPQYSVFHGEPGRLRSLPGIVAGAFHLRSAAVIQLGLLLLIATPVARVVFSAFAFVTRRDYLYVAITLFVLSVLVYNLVKGYW